MCRLGIFRAEKFKGLLFGCGSESEVTGIGQMPTRLYFFCDLIFVFFNARFRFFGFFETASRKDAVQVAHALARLRRVSFVNNDGEVLAWNGAHLLGDDWEFLQSGGDDLLACLQ